MVVSGGEGGGASIFSGQGSENRVESAWNEHYLQRDSTRQKRQGNEGATGGREGRGNLTKLRVGWYVEKLRGRGGGTTLHSD